MYLARVCGRQREREKKKNDAILRLYLAQTTDNKVPRAAHSARSMASPKIRPGPTLKPEPARARVGIGVEVKVSMVGVRIGVVTNVVSVRVMVSSNWPDLGSGPDFRHDRSVCVRHCPAACIPLESSVLRMDCGRYNCSYGVGIHSLNSTSTK